MMDYPKDKRLLPTTGEARNGLFDAELSYGEVNGWLVGETNKGDKRKYIFCVRWSSGRAVAKVSTGDASLGTEFDYRGNRYPDEELKGMPKKHRRDLQEYAIRIAEHIRKKYFLEQDFIESRIENYSIHIGSIYEIGGRSYSNFRDGGWLLTRQINYKNSYVSARYIGQDAQAEKFLQEFRKVQFSKWESASRDAVKVCTLGKSIDKYRC